MRGGAGAARVSSAPPGPPPFEMFSRAAGRRDSGVCDAEERAPPARRAAKAVSGVADGPTPAAALSICLRARRRTGRSFGAPSTGPTRRGGGGRSFRVNSSERFRGEGAEAPPRPSGTWRGAGRSSGPARARMRPRGDRAAPRLTTLSPETRLAEERRPERPRAEGHPRASRAHTPTRQACEAPPFALGAARAADHTQETVSHRCRKR